MPKNKPALEEVTLTIKIGLQDRLSDVGRMNLRRHVEDAIESWGGQFRPEELLFDTIVYAKASTTGLKKLG